MRARPSWRLAAVVAIIAVLAGCGGIEPTPKVDFLSADLGGDTTAKALRGRGFNQSARNLTNAGLRQFGDGADVFDATFTEPKLGPAFNADSCLGCHHDGAQTRASGDTPPGLIVRISVPGSSATGEPAPEPTYGLQVQTDGPGAEATVSVRRQAVRHTWATGRTTELSRVVVDLTDGPPLADGAMQTVRMAPPIIGLGLLEAIPAASIEAAADPDDLNGDGVSGRVNRVWDQRLEDPVIGRFGWKAGQPTVAQQTEVALHDDMGIATSAQPDPCRHQGTLCTAPPTPIELDDARLSDLVFYNRTIAVPVAKDTTARSVRAGAAGFERIGCAACHTPTQRSGSDPIAALAGQTFHPYTDLLLHDMGDRLADGRPEFLASGREWRTAPLWGLSRRAQVTGSPTLLHDGRARSVTEAILWHGGEGRRTRLAFERLSDRDRRDLLAFLDTL